MISRVARRSAAALALVVLALAAPAAAGGEDPRTYEVTITNLTTGQPLTPPVIATHNGGEKVFKVGKEAGLGVQEIAENGNGSVLLDQFASSKHVSAFLMTGTGPLVPAGTPGSGSFGEEVTFTITAGQDARFISYVSMLICTNDGFTGVGGLRLPQSMRGITGASTFAYDAGTELNTEDLADIVPPCQGLIGVSDDNGAPGTGTTNPALAEGGDIHHHEGIVGGSDLTQAAHGWDPAKPVARIIVERIG